MSFDAKGIGLFVWKIIRFSAICSYKFVRKYPVVSGFVIFVSFVYIYFPSFFYILLYASPILTCTAIFIRFYWRTKHPDVQLIKKKDSEERSSADVNRSNEEKSGPDVKKSNGPSLRPQKSVRRNARKAVLSFDRNDSPNLLNSRSLYDILSGKPNLLEENSGLDSDVNRSSNGEHGESSSQNENGNDQALHKPKSLFNNETSKPHSASGDSFEGHSGKSLEEREHVEDKKVKEDRNKAVEWRKDDEKKLMDLGLTEMERNKRLESLIAKRRARKMFKKAIEKSLMDKGIVPHSQIAPILIVKNNIFGGSSNPNEEGLPMPGSAPSVLLPTQNPFDLPYDPFEEKPNLTADSFQQEFVPPNQKEMLFCRHESFSHGPLFTFETSHDPNNDPFNPYYRAEKMVVEAPQVDRSKKVPDDEGGHHQNHSHGFGSEIDLVEVEESNNEAMNSSEEKTEKIRETANDKTEIGETHDLSGNEVMKMDNTKNNDSCYSPSSSDDSESGLDQTTKPMSLCTNQVRKAFNLSIPPKGKSVSKLPNDSSPFPRRAEFNLFYNSHRRQGHHTRNCSIASDLQVEVSEVGSPTLLTDGTISPVEGDSVTYDGDVERDVDSDGEELWGDSFNLTRETNREKLRELDDIIEEDSVDVKLSGLNKKREEPIASISPSLQEAKKILNTASALSSRLDTTENQGQTKRLMEKTEVHSPSGSCFQKPEQLIDPQHKPTEEVNNICNVEPTTQGDANTLDPKSSEIRDNGVRASLEPTALGEIRKPDKEIDLGSSHNKHGNIETSYESKRTTESEKKMEESQPSNYIEEDTRDLAKQGTGDAPNAVQSIDDLQSVPDSRFNRNIAEDNVPRVEQRLESSIPMALNRRLTTEQTYLTSCASPRSVLPQNILADCIPISNVEQQRQTDRPQSVMEDIARDNSADNQPHENSSFNMPQITQKSVENSVDHSSSSRRPGTSEGSSNTTKRSINGSTVHDMNELVLEGTHGKEDSSTKSSKDESKTSTSSKDAKELTKPSGGSNPDSIASLGGSEKLIEYNTGTDPSKSKEGNAQSDDPKTMVKEKSAAEADRICSVNDSSIDKVTKNESSNHILDGEGDPQISSRQNAVMEHSKISGETSAGSVKDTVHESKRLTEENDSNEVGK